MILRLALMAILLFSCDPGSKNDTPKTDTNRENQTRANGLQTRKYGIPQNTRSARFLVADGRKIRPHACNDNSEDFCAADQKFERLEQGIAHLQIRNWFVPKRPPLGAWLLHSNSD